MSAGTCGHCGKVCAEYTNYCNWDCHVAAAEADGGHPRDEAMNDIGEAFGAEEHEDGLRRAQELVCSAAHVIAIVHLGYPPPYVAHVYLLADNGKTWAGTSWRDDRWPTSDEVRDGLRRWRGRGAPEFTVTFWQGCDEGAKR